MKKICLLLSLLLILLTGCQSIDDPVLHVHFFGVNKADCILIYDNDSCIMIDTGESDDYDQIQDYLDQQNISRIDYLFITHFDKDHVGSAAQLILHDSIQNIITGSINKDSDDVDDYLEAIEEENQSPVICHESQTIELSNMTITLYPANGDYQDKVSNNSSLIIAIRYQNWKLLFMGDAMDERITEFLKQSQDEYDVIKMPYHGQYLSTLSSLLSVTSPTYGIITNKEDEDDITDTLSLLKSYNVETYITGDGAIDLTIDHAITINISKGSRYVE